MAKSELKTASVLAFERKLDPSDALLYAGHWQDGKNLWLPIQIRTKSVRGTISNRLKTKDQDPAKLDASIQNANLPTVDVATLPNNADTLLCRFTLRILGGAGIPSACNRADYQAALESVVQGYANDHKFSELARRYACNLANGRFLHRNRMTSEQVEVHIQQLRQGKQIQSWVFNAFDFNLRNFEIPKESETSIKELATVIQEGLTGSSFVLLDVHAYARMGDGQEVYPSQELILDKKVGKSKTLYDVQGVAAMHSQKIGNALRTIDDWYDTTDVDGGNIGPIAVEPYGSVTTRGTAYRKPKQKMDFYSLLDSWVLNGKVPSAEQQHYVLANLIRGGVFGDAEKG
ncbi:CRISPR-associated protein Csy3 [Gammaproteobacteria bacterium]